MDLHKSHCSDPDSGWALLRELPWASEGPMAFHPWGLPNLTETEVTQ